MYLQGGATYHTLYHGCRALTSALARLSCFAFINSNTCVNVRLYLYVIVKVVLLGRYNAQGLDNDYELLIRVVEGIDIIFYL